MQIRPTEPAKLPFWLQFFFRRQKKIYGQALQPALMWARKPSLFVLFSGMWATLSRKSSPLPPLTRALVQVYVAKLNWCEFCVDLNSLNLATQTNGEEKLLELENWQHSPLFTEQEKTALAWTKAMSGDCSHFSEELRKDINSYYTEDQIMELTALIAFQNMSARFNAALDIPAQGLCKVQPKQKPKSSDN